LFRDTSGALRETLRVNTDRPLLVSKAEASFQLSLPEAEVEELVRLGELATVYLRKQELVVFESLVSLVRKKRRQVRV
jgi:hypothetical protein